MVCDSKLRELDPPKKPWADLTVELGVQRVLRHDVFVSGHALVEILAEPGEEVLSAVDLADEALGHVVIAPAQQPDPLVQRLVLELDLVEMRHSLVDAAQASADCQPVPHARLDEDGFGIFRHGVNAQAANALDGQVASVREVALINDLLFRKECSTTTMDMESKRGNV